MYHNCPYCNAEVDLKDMRFPHFTSPCCQKIVVCKEWGEPQIMMHCAADAYMIAHQVRGDNTQTENPAHMNPRETEPRWAHVYTNGPFWHVRIIPPTDLREHGRGHGVALANQYTTKAEANRFADSMEKYFGDAEKQLTQDDQGETPCT